MVFCRRSLSSERWLDAFWMSHSQCAIHLIGRDMIESFAFILLRQRLPIQLSSLEQGESSHHVCFSECEWVLDTTVYMALGSEVDDTINLFVLHKFVEGIEVADIHLHKFIIWLILNILEVSKVSCVGKLIKVDNSVLRILVYKEAYYMATYEACTTSDDDCFHRYMF